MFLHRRTAVRLRATWTVVFAKVGKGKGDEKMLFYHSWSGGKDSTASIILDNLHNLPPSKIIMSEVMFDNKRGISGELPEHMEWVHNKAIPLFQRWGYEVDILRSEKDYLDLFYHVVSKSRKSERNGKYRGWLIGGMCVANNELKMEPIRNFYKKVTEPYIQYVGIAADEPKRLERLNGTNKVSLLARYGYTENMAYELCREYNLLSPIYSFTKRGGCWFCPSATYAEFANIKAKHPELWKELKRLSNEKNLASTGFKYGETFDEVNAKVDEIIDRQRYEAKQITFEDLYDELAKAGKEKGEGD